MNNGTDKLKLIDIVKMHEIRIQELEKHIIEKNNEVMKYQQEVASLQKKYSFLIDFIGEINQKIKSK
jgi:hypothetical protein